MAEQKKLQFKMGAFAGLNAATKKAGTVYVTTDEKAMYVDIDDTTRIRIGDVIQVNTVNNLRDMAPDYSPTALYYVIDENALLKYTGDGTNHTWKQINSVSDIVADIDALETKVGTLETAVKKNTDAIGKASASGTAATGIYARIEALEAEDAALDGRLDTAESSINSLKTSVGASTDTASASGSLYARIKKNSSDITDLKNNTGTLTTDLTNLTTRVSTAEGEIDQLQTDLTATKTSLGTSSDTSSKNTAFGRIKALEETDATHTADIKTATDKANANATSINGLKTRMDTAEGNITTNANAIVALQEQIGDGEGLTGRITDLESDMTTAKSNITTLTSNLTKLEGTVSDHTTKLGTVESTANTNKSNIESLTTTVNGHTTSITNLQTAIGSDDTSGLRKRIKANETAIGKSSDTATAAKSGSLYARTNKNADDISSLATRVGTTESAITTLNSGKTVSGSVDYKVDQAETRLKAQITSSINAANAMDFKGTVSSQTQLNGITSPKIGDTYVVTSAFGSYTEGDLLVANGTESNGVITGTIQWQHVPTGYRTAHNPELKGANNAITLTSLQGAGVSLGSVAFEAVANSSTTVSVADNKVTIGMEWGSF